MTVPLHWGPWPLHWDGEPILVDPDEWDETEARLRAILGRFKTANREPGAQGKGPDSYRWR